MYDGFIQLGADELANVARFKAYIEGYAQSFPWVKSIAEGEAEALRLALGDDPYVSPAADNAPWYDPGDPASANFYGIYITGIEGDEDDTRSAEFTQSIGDGGTVGTTRRSTRQMRVKAVLAARDEFAMEAGLRWLRRTIDPDDCPGGDCGTMTLCTYAAAPGFLDGCDPYDYSAVISRTNEVLDPAMTNRVAAHWRAAVGTYGSSGFGGIYSTAAALTTGTELVVGDAAMLASNTIARSGGVQITNISSSSISLQLGIRRVTGVTADAPILGPVVAIPAGQSKRVIFSALALAAQNTGYTVSLVAASAIPAGAGFKLGSAIVEAAPVVGNPFSGDSADTDSITYLWLARPGDSASRVFTAGVDPSRHLNGVTAIAGPSINTRRRWPGGVMREVEFGLESQTPYFFSTARRMLDSSSVIAGSNTYYDYGALQSVNHVFDPRGVIAGHRVITGVGGAVGTLAPNTITGGSPGAPEYAQGNYAGLRVTVTTAGTSLAVTPAAPISTFYRKVTAGSRYVASLYGISSVNNLALRVGIIWYDATGAFLQQDNGAVSPTSGPSGTAAYKRYSIAATAPVGAVYGGIAVSLYGVAGGALAVGQYFGLNWWQFELARNVPGQVADQPSMWFDADVVRVRPASQTNFNIYYDPTDIILWEGAAHASASWRFKDWMCDWSFENGRWTQQNKDPLLDPLAGALPTPPAPPVINPTIPDPGFGGWVRSAYGLPAISSQENGIAVPTIGLSVPVVSGAPTTVRQVRIRFYGNPLGVAPKDINPCDYCAELTLSYVQAGTQFIIDGETQSVSAIIGGETFSANEYVYGEGGGPVQWPELECGIPYVVTIDQPRSTTVAATPIAVTIDMTQRM